MKPKVITYQQLIQYIRQMSKPFYPYLACTLLLVVLESFILAVFMPRTIEKIADITRLVQNPIDLFHSLRWSLFLFMLWQCILEINLRLQDYFFSIKTVPKLSADIYDKHVSKLLDQSYQFYQYNSPGVLSNNLTRLVDAVPSIVESFVLKFTFLAFTFAVAIWSLWRVAFFSGVLLVFYLVFMMLVVSIYNRKINLLTMQWTSKRSRITARILDIITNIFTIKLFSGKKRERKSFLAGLYKTCHDQQQVEYVYLIMSALLGFGYLLLQGLSIYLLLYKPTQGVVVSVGQLVSVLYLNETVASLIWDELPDFLQFSEQVGKARQSLALEYEPILVKDQQRAQPLVVSRGHIHFDCVRFAFSHEETPFFNDFSLDIPAGQRIGLVGATGSGKSTLVKLLLRLYDIQGGTIRIDGQNIAEVTQKSIYEHVGLIPQETTLLQRSLRENLTYGHTKVDDAMLIEAAKKAKIHDFIMSTERGYDSLVGEGGIAPSGGERQRLSVARLLLFEPSIIVLDEATSHLDSITEKSINDTLNIFMHGKTTIIIAHRLSTLRQVDRIVVLNNGRIVEDGTHDALLRQKGLYAHFWHTQSHGNPL